MAGEVLQRSGVDPAQAARPTEHHVSSCLPFLVLGQWADIGLLDTIAVAFDDADQLDLLPALALGLAARMLPAPQLGWYRTPDELTTLAVFAGVDDPSMRWQERFDHFELLTPIRAAVTEAVIGGRNAGSPLLSTVGRSGVVVADAGGCFPLLWEAHPFALAALHERLGRPKVLTAGQGVRRLDELVNRLAASAASEPRRPIDGVLDSLAACGLGMVAWRLAAASDPNPLFALEHLADLDADVTLLAERLVVRVPLGARFFALSSAGLLETVTDVPWLPGVSLEFSGA
jgi:hypothetical protein